MSPVRKENSRPAAGGALGNTDMSPLRKENSRPAVGGALGNTNMSPVRKENSRLVVGAALHWAIYKDMSPVRKENSRLVVGAALQYGYDSCKKRDTLHCEALGKVSIYSRSPPIPRNVGHHGYFSGT